MQHTGEAPLIALEVGLAAATVVLMGYPRPVWHFIMFVWAPDDFVFQVLLFGRPRATKENAE